MNYKQVEIILEKINRLYKSMSTAKTESSAIEHDLLKSYVRNLYESIIEEDDEMPNAKSANQRVETVPQIRIEEPLPPKEQVVQVAQETHLAQEASNRSKVEENAKRAAEILRAQGQYEEKVYTPPVQVAAPPAVEAVRENIPQVQDSGDEIMALFQFKEATELSERLGESPIKDLNKALGVNEKIFTINELFGGDKGLYQNTVTAINGMSNFHEAKDYLIANVARNNNWASNNSRKKAKVFIKLVKRRFA